MFISYIATTLFENRSESGKNKNGDVNTKWKFLIYIFRPRDINNYVGEHSKIARN